MRRCLPTLLVIFSLAMAIPAVAAVAPVPDLQKETRDHLASIGDEELAAFREAMAADPASAPEMLSAMLPESMRGELARLSDHFLANADEALAEREAISTLITLTRILPPEQLDRLGIDAETLQQLEGTFRELSPLELTVLHGKTSASRAWQESRARALESIPEAVRAGSAALAAHGELTASDRIALDEFRAEIASLMRRLDSLPPSLRAHLPAENIRLLTERMESATPEVLFMIRSELPEENVATIVESLEFLESLAAMSAADLAELEAFRAELHDAIGAPGSAAEVDALRPDQLVALQGSLGAAPEWQTVLPAVTATLRNPALAQRIAAADPVALEAFRGEAIAFVQSAQAGGSIAPRVATRSLAILRDATPRQLAVIQSAASALGGDASAGALATVPIAVASAVNLNCVVSLGTVDLPDPLGDLSLGSIDFNWICGPLEDAINTVASTVDGIVADLTKTVNDISTFVKTIPDEAATALTSAFKDLLDVEIANGVSLLDIANADNLGS
ncbi:MAG: hypothetical protein ACRD2J_06810, partial [Thermoanaerobaculia bacterium]